ncbi:MAG: SNF2-related protein [bacterium]
MAYLEKRQNKKTRSKSWWGREWLSVIENLNEDRVNDDESYSNPFKITDFKYQNGKITAKVAENRSTYYVTEISLEAFAEQDLKVLAEILASSSLIHGDLALGKLPTILNTELLENGINLFPISWKDIKSKCNCPSPANPCEHQSELFYMIGTELDKDPSLLLKLRGVPESFLNSESQVGKRTLASLIKNILEETVVNEPVSLKLRRMSDREGDEKADIGVFVEQSLNAQRDYNQPLNNLEFDSHLWLNLLSDNPSFDTASNFKIFLRDLYNSAALKADTLYKPVVKGTARKRISSKLKKTNDENADLNMQVSEQFDDLEISFNAKATSYECLFDFSVDLRDLLKCSLNQDLNLISPRLAFTLLLMQTAIYIIKLGLYSPELLFKNEQIFQIRYTPIFNNASLSQRLNFLKTLYPDDLIKNSQAENATQDKPNFLKSCLMNELLSFLVTVLLKKLTRNLKVLGMTPLKTAFLTNAEFIPNGYADEAVAKSLSNWLARFYIQGDEIKPLIRLEEHEGTACKPISSRLRRTEGDENAEIEDGEQSLEVNFKLHVDVTNTSKFPNEIVSLESFTVKAREQCPDVYKQLNLIQEYIPEIKQVLATEGKAAPILSINQVSSLLANAKNILSVLGINILVPKALQKILKPKLTVKVNSSSSQSNNAFLIEQALSFSYEIALGRSKINLSEFKKLVKSSSGLVKFNDEYVMLNPAEIALLFKRALEPLPQIETVLDALHYGLAGKLNGLDFSSDAFIDNLIKSISVMETEISLPKNLKATLRPYQERGFEWLYTNYQNRLGSCLADDMGLGKTLQVLTLLLKIHQENAERAVCEQPPSLVICPTSLIGNWFKESSKFTPDLKVAVYHGPRRSLDYGTVAENAEIGVRQECHYEGMDLVITSYGILRQDIAKFSEREWNLLIIDEAQNIKNHETKQAKAIRALKAKNYIAMSGTPVENNLSELWSIFDFINPRYLRSIKDFTDEYSIPIEKYRDQEKIAQLKRVTSPFLLRRLKTDKSIIQDLPEKIINDQFVYLTKEQTALYQSVVNNALEQIAGSEGIERKGKIFKLVTSLKQLSNHPSNYTKQEDYDFNLSGKAIKLIDILREILISREKALIFTQYTEMGDILLKMIKAELGSEALFYHGSLDRKRKDEMVEEFQNAYTKKIMVISLKAGGTGLNLTAANHVIHYDLWWNPAVENQATDRAFRIGQKKNVMVHRLISMGTFEEKINDLLKAKQQLADLSVSVGENWITEMSNEELRGILGL